MNSEPQLPEGVEYKRNVPGGFELGVSMPTGDDQLSQSRCPDEPDHRFKMAFDPTTQSFDEPAWCPYCGKQATAKEFMPEQMARARVAAQQVAHAYVANKMDKILRDAFGARHTGRNTGFSVHYTPARRLPFRPLPTYDVEPTRRTMTCNRCHATCAVYNVAIFCPTCGLLAPAQQLATLIAVQASKVSELDSLDPDTTRRMTETGALTSIYESSLKDAFTALELYLKNRFFEEAPPLPKPPSTTTFQRLNDANDLYKRHLNIDLKTLAGPNTWSSLERAAAIRHVLIHNGGVIDSKFLQRMPHWHQAEGQKIVTRREDAVVGLDALTRFAAAVIP